MLSLDIYFDVWADGAGSQEVEQHLEMGNKLLAAGQLADALSHYHAAVDGDPSNYLTYFKRATVYLALGKSKSALPDLDKVIQLKKDFKAARMQRANVLLKQGKLQEAEEDYTEVLKQNPSNEDAARHLSEFQQIKADIELAKDLYRGQDFQGAIDVLGKIIEICPWDPEFREIRAECYIAQGEFFKAIGDIRPTTKLRNDNTKGYYKLSLLHYDIGDADESLTQIRECLKLDPDHKECFPHYKKVKKLVKQMQSAQDYKNGEQYQECVDKAKQILKTEPNVFHYVIKAKSFICHCNSKVGNIKEAFISCNEVLDQDPDNIDALIDRAETFIANEQFDEAIRDYQEAQNKDEENRRVREGLNKAHKLKKQSERRDYYKILGVKRTARKKEILKAYRKLAIKWHPDKHEGADKSKAEKKFLDIAAAKEVLTDPEKRQKYDNGEDPLDPESHNGGNPFQGFNPFGSGGFQFKFHFN